jgi:pyruvate formate lyase activating enzyme
VLNRQGCTGCGRCIGPECPALEIIGRETDAESVIAEVLKDAVFYEQSGGGMTLSGGEPLMQGEFSRELLRLAKTRGLHTCVETSGFLPSEQIKAVLLWTDVFLFDYKESDPLRHREYTGGDNRIILGNLGLIDRMGGAIILRCPIIPSKNDRLDHFKAIAETAEGLRHIREIHLEPYHPLGESKSARLGRDYPLMGMGFPGNDAVEGWLEAIRAHTGVPVKKA